MRKLLVTSQKGGVGKTTSSINLAAATALAGGRVLLLDADPLSSISSSLNLGQHAQRQSLRQAGIDLPGVLVSNVLPGLDVLSPYEDGGCSDDDLEQMLALLGTSAFQECYSTLIVDTPPFLGANPAQLLGTCDEFILVMRAEPMAARTLPAFLELVQRSIRPEPGREASRPAGISMRGILVTLPEGEESGGRWEREMRGRFGSRILAHVVPHDEAIARALLFGQIVSQADKNSPAARAYASLVESLELAADVRDTIERTSATSALLLASASLKTSATARRPARTPVAILRDKTPTPIRPLPPVAALAPEPAAKPLPVRPAHHPLPLGSDVDAAPSLPPIAPSRSALASHPPAGVDTAAPAPQKPAGKAPDTDGFPLGMGLLWVGLAMVVGVALRFLRLPDYMIPVLVGVGVGVVVVLLLRHFMTQQEQSSQPSPARKPARRGFAGSSPPSPPRTEGRADPGKRLSGLKRRVIAPARPNRDN